MTDSSYSKLTLDDVEPVPDTNEERGGDLVGKDPPAVGHEPTPPSQENNNSDEESSLLVENCDHAKFLRVRKEKSANR